VSDRLRGPHELLIYEYVEDVVPKRAPHRPAHLALVEEFAADGRFLIGGAVGDPPTGGMLVLRDRAAVDAFLARDPYIEAGIVTSHRVERWTLV
jgi:uncharacterized protein YciI